MQEPEIKAENPKEQLLRQIREDFTYCREYWRENYEQARIDLKFVSGDPWEPDARKEREDNGRPVLCPDELDQYLNQTINNLRQNPRGIKVNPAGENAQDQDAEIRGSIIRSIEYKSNAQAAYENAFSGAIQCGFGYFRINTKVTGKNKEQEPRIRIIENPLSVLPDPNAKEADFSDQKICFLFDVMRKSDFERKFPKAENKSFTAEDFTTVNAPGWFDGKNITVAEYWKVTKGEPGEDGVKIVQYITNGLEILEENEWAGSWIPIIPVTGKKTYVPSGSEMKRMYYSMIRKARGPQMMLAYIASQEAEEYGMAPRAPFVGYVGQFETDKDAWDTLNKVPRSYVQVDPVVDQSSNQILPKPDRPAFTPNASAYEIGFERWRRSLQAAMGITPLPTAAQRQNEKSGVALERIQTAQAVGAYHFTDNFDRSLEYAGRQINELITLVMDTERQVSIRNQDETHGLLNVVPGAGKPMGDEEMPEDMFDPQRGEFDVTISTGPSYQSQREEQSEFVDMLAQNLANIPPPGSPQAKILALGIRMKPLGPFADEIAKILDPPPANGMPDLPPQVAMKVQQIQSDNQKLNAACQQLEQELQQANFKLQAKVVDHQGQMEIERMRAATALATAEINASKDQNEAIARAEIARFKILGDLAKQDKANAHDIAKQAHQQAHQSAMQQQAADSAEAQASEAADQAQQ